MKSALKFLFRFQIGRVFLILVSLTLIFIPSLTKAAASWTVSGAGTSSYNGDYSVSGTCNGKTQYKKDDSHLLYWSSVPSAWVLDNVSCAVSSFAYRGEFGSELPANSWAIAFDGLSPPPALSVYQQPSVLTTVAVSPVSVTLQSGETRAFSAQAYDQNGAEMVGVNFSWSVVGASGTVTNAGLFTAGSLTGTYVNTVKAEASGVSGYASVTIPAGSASASPDDGGTTGSGSTGSGSTGGSTSTQNPSGSTTPGTSAENPESNNRPNASAPDKKSTIASTKKSFNQKVVQATKDLSANAPVKVALLGLAAVSAATSTFSLALGALAAQLSLKDYFLIILNYLISIFSVRKKEKQGRVFDEATGKPVNKALVQLFDQKNVKLVSTALTDSDGHYYFTVKPGEYVLSVIKPGYLFPSRLAQRSLNLSERYIGQTIAVTNDFKAINELIPVDPIANADLKKQPMKLVLKLIYFRLASLVVGTAISIYALLLLPNLANYFLIFSFSVLWLAELSIQNRNLRFSRVLDRVSRKPLPLALIRVETQWGKLLETYVADQFGRVLPHADSKGDKLLIEKAGYKTETFHPKGTGLVERMKIFLEKKTL